MSAIEYDVLVIGAGLAGASLACALGQNTSLNIAIIEANTVKTQWPEEAEGVNSFDPRVSSLTVGTQQFLDSIGVWPLMHEQRVCAYDKMSVWDAEGTGQVDFDAADVQQPTMGFLLENQITLIALAKRLQQLPNVQLLSECKVAELKHASKGYAVLLEDERLITAPIIVAADGGNSRIRQWAGFQTREWDYGHHGLVCSIKTELPHQYTARQRFLTSGPLAVLPLSQAGNSDCSGDAQHYSSIVWSMPPEQAEETKALNDEQFCQALYKAFEGQLCEVQEASRRFTFPLRQRHSIDYIKLGLALVGDAAHTIHPLAGQGVNLAFQDVAVLAQEITRATERGLPLDDFSLLQRYQRRRKTDNLAMMAAMEGFKRLFEQPHLPIRWARNMGMHGFNQFAPLKKQVMRKAMGL